MHTAELEQLAEIFVGKTLGLEKGENLLIVQRGVSDTTREMADAFIRYSMDRIGTHAHTLERGSEFTNTQLAKLSDAELEELSEAELALTKKYNKCVVICDEDDLLNIEGTDRKLQRMMKSSRDYRADNMRWILTDAPTPDVANMAGMSLAEFEDFYLHSCSINYAEMTESVEPLRKLLDQTETVRIVGAGTDISFTKKGISSVPCVGVRNLPDGECYTAPEVNSVNGRITFGPSTYSGENFSSIELEFKDGAVISAKGGSDTETEALNRILSVDDGAKYVGEFGIGFNPAISKVIGNILFDEKVWGTIHLALGSAYNNAADNGNRSEIHWDMVHSQRPEYGGGALYFDGVLVRQDGRFVLPELEGLNPENLG